MLLCYVAKLCSYILYKNISLRNVSNYLLLGPTKFHHGVPSNIWKVISPTWKSIFLIKSKKIFCGENLSTEDFWHKFHRLSSLLSTLLDVYIPPNPELILGNWYLASHRQMKHLETNWYVWIQLACQLACNMILHMKFPKGLDKHTK